MPFLAYIYYFGHHHVDGFSKHRKPLFLSVDARKNECILRISGGASWKKHYNRPKGGGLLIDFGIRLKTARIAKHMSQRLLADMVGKSLNTIGLYERGLRQPSLETLCLLAETLDVSCDYLLARTEAKKPSKVLESTETDLSMRILRIEERLGLKVKTAR